jgi:hypothetical protein
MKRLMEMLVPTAARLAQNTHDSEKPDAWSKLRATTHKDTRETINRSVAMKRVARAVLSQA